MSITDNKITRWNNPIVNEADRPQRSASDMKAIFDSNSNQLRTALNNLINHLAASGAEDIGADVEGMESQTVEGILEELKSLIDDVGDDLDVVRSAVLPDGDGTLFLSNNGTWAVPPTGEAANGLRLGGDAGDVYVKKTTAAYDGEWVAPQDLGFLGVDDTAVNASKLGGNPPSHYATAQAVQQEASDRTEAIRSITPASIGAIPASQKGAANGVATLDANKKITAAQACARVVTHDGVTSYTIGADDIGVFHRFRIPDGTSETLTITLPADNTNIPDGAELEVMKMNSGLTVDIACEAGGYIYTRDVWNNTSIRIDGSYGIVTLKKISANPHRWVARGDIK